MKHIHRFFIQTPITTGESVTLDEDDAFHAVRVLRLKEDETVELADGRGRVYSAIVAGVGRGRHAVVEVIPGEPLVQRQASTLKGGLTVVQAIPGGRKMDLIVEKLSEIGVAVLVPVWSENSRVRDSGGARGKIERWRRVARAAAAQSKRGLIMEVAEAQPLSRWLDGYGGQVLALVTEVESSPLGESLAGSASRDEALALVVGPEAGFSAAEIDTLAGAAARFVSLGPLTLRTETAALVAATIVMHRQGRIG
jgi:16S rRNA (uracil1498-N3)-methyltransferase